MIYKSSFLSLVKKGRSIYLMTNQYPEFEYFNPNDYSSNVNNILLTSALSSIKNTMIQQFNINNDDIQEKFEIYENNQKYVLYIFNFNLPELKYTDQMQILLNGFSLKNLKNTFIGEKLDYELKAKIENNTIKYTIQILISKLDQYQKTNTIIKYKKNYLSSLNKWEKSTPIIKSYIENISNTTSSLLNNPYTKLTLMKERDIISLSKTEQINIINPLTNNFLNYKKVILTKSFKNISLNNNMDTISTCDFIKIQSYNKVILKKSSKITT